MIPEWARVVQRLMGEMKHGYVREWGPGYPILRQEDVRVDESIVTVIEGFVLKRWTVERGSIVGPKLTFDYDSGSIGRDKVVANVKVAELMKRGASTGIVVLDTDLGLSSAMLKAATGVEKIHVPNPDGRLAALDGVEGVVWHQVTLLEFLRDVVLPEKMTKLSYWLDFCCTFIGDSGKTRPSVDLELLLLSQSLPKKGGVLAITLCARGTVGGSQAVIENVDSLLGTLSGRYGYSFSRALTHVYGANGSRMVLLGFISY